MALRLRPDWSESFGSLAKVAKEVRFCMGDYLMLTSGPLNHTNFLPETDINLLKRGIVGVMLNGTTTVYIDEGVTPGSVHVAWPPVGQFDGSCKVKAYDLAQLSELTYH